MNIKFPVPQGLSIPEGKQDGDTFDAISTYKIEGSNLCLTAIGEVKLGEYKNEPMPQKNELADKYREGMSETQS